MSATIQSTPAAPPTGYFRNPWRKPRILQGVTIGYLLWSLLPVVIAVIFSFNAGRSRISWQGFSLRWWTQDPTDSLLNDAAMRAAMAQTYKLAIITVAVAVPLGTLFAIGIDRWHGRPARAANFTMLLSFVVPEIILGVSLYILFTNLMQGLVPLGTPAQALGLISFQLSYPVIIVRARLLTIGPEYEEAAMDLGASPVGTFFQVTLPIIAPSVISAWLLAFTLSLDDLVIASFTSGPGATTLPMKIYSQVRLGVTPEINAVSTILVGLVAIGVVAASIVTKRREVERQRAERLAAQAP